MTNTKLEELYKYIYVRDSVWIKDPLKFQLVRKTYENVLNELTSLPKSKSHKMPICVTEYSDGDESYTDVLLLNPKYVKPPKGKSPYGTRKGKKTPRGFYNVNDEKYSKYFAFGMMSWSQLIDTKVINKTKLNDVEILAEILCELTFYGYTSKDCEKQLESLKKTLEKAVKNIDKSKSITVPKNQKDEFNIMTFRKISGT